MVLKMYLVIWMISAIVFSVDGSVQLEVPNNALDNNLYEKVLDPKLCHEQVRLIRGNSALRIMFADAGIRFPRGILTGNNLDLGNYDQCLGINLPLAEYNIQGKYCMIRVPMNQEFELPWQQMDMNFEPLFLDNETLTQYESYDKLNTALHAMSGVVDDNRLPGGNILSGMTFRLAICIPKPCSTQQALSSLLFNLTQVGFQYTDDFCRLPEDKPWVPGDYVVIATIVLLGLITLLSTSYDMWHTFLAKRDPKSASVIGKSFSVYTNGKRLMNFTSGPGTLDCLDGIRSITMAWVLLGHAFTTEPFWSNPIDGWQWQVSYAGMWVVGGHIAVDTFFTMSGLLVVYTTAGKVSGRQLLKNLHLFYLNRLLRMFPLLAIAVLLEGTYLNRMTDGPVWGTVASHVERCRTNWWSTLLHIQNYVTSEFTCIGQTWYLAIDTQLHILSPVVLVFVLSGNKKVAWSALAAALLAILVSSTTYNFIMEFPSTMMSPGRAHQMFYYMFNYYVNTLTRASPFVVGMLFGYLLHTTRRMNVEMTKIQVFLLWVVMFSVSLFVMYTNYPIAQSDWDNQTLDSLFNSFIRPIWAFSNCLMIFACVTGYGGPINWLLSLRIWKLPARISYAMYLFHYMLMLAVNHATVAPIKFSVPFMMFKFLAHYGFSFVVSFLMTLIVDAPFSTLFKLFLNQGNKKAQPQETALEEKSKVNRLNNNVN